MEEIRVFVLTQQGTTIPLSIMESDTILSTKHKIRAKEGVPIVCLVLEYNEEELEDGKAIKDYGITHGCTLALSIRSRMGPSIRVGVRTPSGEVVPMIVEPIFTVMDVKMLVQEEMGVPMERQVLLFHGQSLGNNRKMEEYGIGDRAIVELVVRVPVTIKTLTGITFPLKVTSCQLLNEVKEQIARITMIPPEQQRLLYNGIPIGDNSSIDNYEITSGADIYIVKRVRIYNVSVTTESKRTIKLKVNASTTIRKVKKMIESIEGVSRHQQILTLSGVALADKRRMGYYHRFISSKCRLVLKSRVVQYQVFVRTLSGKIISLEVRGSDTVKELKRMIWEKEGVPPDQQRIMHGGWPLREGKGLADCGLCNGTTIDMSVRLMGGMQIRVKEFSSGETFYLSVAEDDTIESVKDKIQQNKGILAIEQRLTFKGNGLEDGKTLQYYEINDAKEVLLHHLPPRMTLTVKTDRQIISS